jgi:transcription initiation factor TFIIIB Brf1 subunit/transcription initiation factor TFIIB
VAAGIIFYVSEKCHLGITKVQIKHVTGISEVTVNKCFHKLNLHASQKEGNALIPNVLLNKYTKS